MQCEMESSERNIVNLQEILTQELPHIIRLKQKVQSY